MQTVTAGGLHFGFQFLIGRLDTDLEELRDTYGIGFQFLIGRLDTRCVG